MRLAMFRYAGDVRLGSVRETDVVEITLPPSGGGKDAPRSLMDLIVETAGEPGRVRNRLSTAAEVAVHALGEVELLPPLDPPRGNILAIGRNYRAHAEESARTQNTEVKPPTVFTKAQTSIVGPHDAIRIDARLTSRVDWEAELAVIIGRQGINIPREEALDHVLGYTVINDVSARDIQHDWGGQFFKGKSLDTFGPVGPWIVTADEVPDPQRLRIICRVNGTVVQDTSTIDMIYSVAEIIARLSEGMTLLPGTLIATGTPAGVGQSRTPPQFLQPGDVLETEVEGIGVLRNPVTAV